MPGPRPKPPELRQRRNRASTHEVLDPTARVKAAPLTKELLGVDEIRPQVKRWWGVVWRSPMASQWIDADVEVLYLIAVLRNRFAAEPTPTLASEIRQQEARLGLDVMARRRLDWRIESSRTEPARSDAEPSPQVSAAAAGEGNGDDPRSILRVVG